jgi:hypothetical protein
VDTIDELDGTVATVDEVGPSPRSSPWSSLAAPCSLSSTDDPVTVEPVTVDPVKVDPVADVDDDPSASPPSFPPLPWSSAVDDVSNVVDDVTGTDDDDDDDDEDVVTPHRCSWIHSAVNCCQHHRTMREGRRLEKGTSTCLPPRGDSNSLHPCPRPVGYRTRKLLERPRRHHRPARRDHVPALVVHGIDYKSIEMSTAHPEDVDAAIIGFLSDLPT